MRNREGTLEDGRAWRSRTSERFRSDSRRPPLQVAAGNDVRSGDGTVSTMDASPSLRPPRTGLERAHEVTADLKCRFRLRAEHRRCRAGRGGERLVAEFRELSHNLVPMRPLPPMITIFMLHLRLKR
jgi:hypothetical protein